MIFKLDSSKLIPEEKPLQILVATGLKPLPSDFNSKTDYDDDGLSNNEEINWDSGLIKNGELPSILECMNYFKEEEKLTYVEQGLDRFIQSNLNNLYSNLENVYILPIRSDPLSIDGDGDGLLDCTENTLVTKYTGKDDIRAFLYDDNPLRKETIFEWPVKFLDGGKATYISSSFTEYECEERNGKAHCAIDIVAPNNTPVYASIPGKVTYAGYANSWGNTVEILSVVNGRILLTKYNHLNEVLVNTGDEVVSADTLIGKVGNTGYSFGNHLDFIVCDITNGFDGNIENYVGTQCQSFGTTINPLLFNKTIEWSDRNDFSTKKIKTINRNIYDSIMNFPKNLYHSCNDSKCTQCKVSADEINERFLFK